MPSCPEGRGMILVRDLFRLKFGKARDALAAFKEIEEPQKFHAARGIRLP